MSIKIWKTAESLPVEIEWKPDGFEFFLNFEMRIEIYVEIFAVQILLGNCIPFQMNRNEIRDLYTPRFLN